MRLLHLQYEMGVCVCDGQSSHSKIKSISASIRLIRIGKLAFILALANVKSDNILSHFKYQAVVDWFLVARKHFEWIYFGLIPLFNDEIFG